MSLYALIGHDRPESLQLRMSVRAEHLQRVRKLADEGRIAIAGPFPAVDADEPTAAGFTGSLIVAEFDSLEQASEWFAADPYVTAGVFARYEVRPFLRVLP
jgi:uncharacterized protein YciI